MTPRTLASHPSYHTFSHPPATPNPGFIGVGYWRLMTCVWQNPMVDEKTVTGEHVLVMVALNRKCVDLDSDRYSGPSLNP